MHIITITPKPCPQQCHHYPGSRNLPKLRTQYTPEEALFAAWGDVVHNDDAPLPIYLFHTDVSL